MFVRFLEIIGASVLELLYFIGDVMLLFIGAVKQLPVKIRVRHVIHQMSHLGVDTLPIVSLTMMFTGMVTQIPNYIILSYLGLNNTYFALILPACAYSMGLYLMKQFMEQIPDSLLESARLDGASEFKVFRTIMMPNVKPAWLTLAIFQFQSMWGNQGTGFLSSEQ